MTCKQGGENRCHDTSAGAAGREGSRAIVQWTDQITAHDQAEAG